MAGILDVAREAGVSKSTVSRVINNNGPVDQQTRYAIIAAMQKLNYRPNVFAQGMRTNKSRSIGILFPDLSNPFFIEWFRTAEAVARQRGYMIYICITDESGATEMNTTKDLLARSIDGLVFFSYQRNSEVMQYLRNENSVTPVIFADPDDYEMGDAYIFSNGHKGTYDAVAFLINSSRKRIAYIRGEERFWVTKDRYKGYLQALDDHGIVADQQLVVEGDFHNESGYNAAKKLMKLPEPPDAIVSATDGMALGVLRYLREIDVRIPEQVAIVGFDNLATTKITDPPLSTIATDIAEMAATAIGYLIDKIENPATPLLQKIFDAKLILRQSAGEPHYMTNQLFTIN